MLDVFSNPPLFIGRIIALVVALTFHEFAHAFSAYQLGDSTAQRAGRLTLNPLAHLDPIGSVMMILVGFGWAKPVPVNPANLKGDKLRSMAITALAGPLSNILQAFIFALPIRFGLVNPDMPSVSGAILPTVGQILTMLVWINLILAVFNMIPLGPLDGMKVLLGLVPRELAYRLEPLSQYGSMILVLLMVWRGGYFLSMLISPPASNMFGLLTGSW
ncbi:MAG: site-2 protease family protein [Anaerolineales bacterium]|nr:site-2 protease family protein [Anaerolineales bacterium]